MFEREESVSSEVDVNSLPTSGDSGRRHKIGRRTFLIAAAATPALLSGRQALAQSGNYPRAHEVGTICECVLWMCHYTNRSENTASIEPWLLKVLYTNPLITSGGKTGVLDALIAPRVVEAHNVLNSAGREMIRDTKRDEVLRAIQDFSRGASSADKRMSMAELMLNGIYYDGTNVPGPTEYLLLLLYRLHQAGIYFPPNHVSRTPEDHAIIEQLLGGNAPLWDIEIPYRSSMTQYKKLGDMHFEDMFNSELRRIYRERRISFEVLKLAKDVGIFSPHPSHPMTAAPDLTVAEIEQDRKLEEGLYQPNDKCCDVAGTGQCMNYPGKYCAPISSTNLQCSSMSQSCP